MDKEDENFYEKSDWNTYNDERIMDTCSYCGDEFDKLNMVYYAINKDYDIINLAVNPLPHEHIEIPEGYKKRYEMVCDHCLKTEYNK